MGVVALSARNEGYWAEVGDDRSESDGGSRPSYAKCPDPDSGSQSAQNPESGSGEGSAIPSILASFREEFSDLARLAVSLVPERKLRKECVQEIRGHRHGERYKSRVLAGVLKAFLRWYLGKEEEEIIFEAGDGTELRVDAPNSYSDDYGRQWYERLKDTERALVYDAPKPHTAMLSLTASTTDGDGRPRPPGDHLAGLQETWTNHTRKALQRALEDAGFTERYDPAKHADSGTIDSGVRSGMKMVCDNGEPARWWDYLTVVEPRGGGGDATGYAHFQVRWSRPIRSRSTRSGRRSPSTLNGATTLGRRLTATTR